MPFVELVGVTKTFRSGAGPFTAVSSVDFHAEPGEFVAVVGPSGSGKSTLLNLLAGIDRPTAGAVRVGKTRVDSLSEANLSVWRGRAVGIVFQFFQLLPTLTAAENVMLPMDLCSLWPASERRPRAIDLLDRLGVADQADKLPAALSGGQQQRVAVARALANSPPLILADEPTGNLDSVAAAGLLEAFAALREEGRTVVMVTHERAAERVATRTVALRDGRVVHPGSGHD